MILFKNKKIISFLVASILVLSFSVCAYADDDPEDFVSSGDSDIITDDMVDAEIQSIANNLYQIQLLNDTRATTYTATDIYNFMVNHFLMGGAQNGYMYQQYSTLLAMNTKLQAIMSYANSIREYTELIHDSVTGDNTPITLYDLIGDHLGNISNMLGVTEGNTTLSAAELLLLINNTIDDSYLALGNIQTTLDSIQDNIALLYAVMTDIAESNNDIVTQTTTMNANMQTMIARLQSMQNDFNNINWQSLSTTFFGYYDIDKNQYTSGDSISDSVYLNFSNFNTSQSYSYIYLFDIPFRPSNNVSRLTDFIKSIQIVQYQSNGSSFVRDFDYYYYYDIARGVIHLYCTKLNPYTITTSSTAFTSNTFSIQFDLNYSGFYTFNNPTVSYITSNYADYFYIYNFIINRKNFDTINTFKDLYASDDLIAAKQDQQSYEDQAIEDFTGSGSASASISDLGGLKSVSSAFKSGLDSGASVSNALSIFSSNSGFWGWFSQSNYNDINNLANSNTNTRSGYNVQESIIDFYSDNMFHLMYLIQNPGD